MFLALGFGMWSVQGCDAVSVQPLGSQHFMFLVHCVCLMRPYLVVFVALCALCSRLFLKGDEYHGAMDPPSHLKGHGA